MKDYGSVWRILRTSSLTDQIFIKAQRIRNLLPSVNPNRSRVITTTKEIINNLIIQLQ